MIIKSINVKNFRSVLDETLHCDQLTVLVGPNGSGKSSFLKALDLFYTTNPKFSVEDFYAEDPSKDIEITITFMELDEEEREHFASYLESDRLTVTRVLSLAGGKSSAKYHGSSLQNAEFAAIRVASDAATRKKVYEKLQEDPKYADLPKWKKQEDALASLKTWEMNHPELCTRQPDDGQFFGFTEVAYGYLGRYTRFILIPAVRDASDDVAEGKGSPITQIMDLVVRNILAQREDLVKLIEEAQKRYNEIMEPKNLTELNTLENQLTITLKTYVPEASVSLSWIKGGDIDFPMPKAEVKLVEDGYLATVIRTGHGLQRAFILTMLQHLAIAQAPRGSASQGPVSADETSSSANGKSIKFPNLILAIEEPELYQHPNRQRHLAKMLIQLATGAIPGVAQKTQVIYSTHSPLFVSLDRFDQIRKLQKVVKESGKPKITQIEQTSLDEVAQKLFIATCKKGSPFTSETLRPRLQTIMTPWMNEGFFADVVVLVEGEDDRAAILGTAVALGYDFEANGISVIPCIGKNSIDRPFVIFQQLNIPAYIIWDSDEGDEKADPNCNRYLLRLLGCLEEDWPASLNTSFACFKKNLETTLREEIGVDLFDNLIQETKCELDIRKNDQALKNPVVIKMIIDRAKKEGKSCPTLQCIVENIFTLNPRKVNS
jgi:predicted ATP-dependent endonuclease of OLD family